MTIIDNFSDKCDIETVDIIDLTLDITFIHKHILPIIDDGLESVSNNLTRLSDLHKETMRIIAIEHMFALWLDVIYVNDFNMDGDDIIPYMADTLVYEYYTYLGVQVEPSVYELNMVTDMINNCVRDDDFKVMWNYIITTIRTNHMSEKKLLVVLLHNIIFSTNSERAITNVKVVIYK